MSLFYQVHRGNDLQPLNLCNQLPSEGLLIWRHKETIPVVNIEEAVLCFFSVSRDKEAGQSSWEDDLS